MGGPGEQQKASTRRHVFTRRDKRVGQHDRGSVNLKAHQVFPRPSKVRPACCNWDCVRRRCQRIQSLDLPRIQHYLCWYLPERGSVRYQTFPGTRHSTFARSHFYASKRPTTIVIVRPDLRRQPAFDDPAFHQGVPQRRGGGEALSPYPVMPHCRGPTGSSSVPSLPVTKGNAWRNLPRRVQIRADDW